MRPIRVLRILGLAGILPILFSISQRVSEARGNPPLPGTSWALGAVGLLFLVRAIVTERTQGAEMDVQKDFLWGIGAGAYLTILLRAWGA